MNPTNPGTAIAAGPHIVLFMCSSTATVASTPYS